MKKPTILLADIALIRPWPQVKIGRTAFFVRADPTMDGGIDVRLIDGSRTLVFRGRDPTESFRQLLRTLRECHPHI